MEASTSATPEPTIRSIAAAYAVVGVFAAVAACIDSKVDVTLHVREQFVAFAVFYIVAQAVERFVEPIIGQVKKDETANAKQAVKDAAADADEAHARPD